MCRGILVQVNKINIQSSIERLSKTVSKPVKTVAKQVSKISDKVILAAGVAAASGAYIVSKSSREHQKKEILKSMNLNDETAQKVLDAKNQEGKPIFNLRNIKALKDASQKDDKYFYSYVMKNIDDITDFSVTKNRKHHATGYTMDAKKPDGTSIESEFVVKKHESVFETHEKTGNKTIHKTRVDNKNSLEESEEHVVQEKKRVKRHKQFKWKKEDKTVLSQTVTYDKRRNKSIRYNNDLNDTLEVKSSKATYFTPQGVIKNITKTEYDIDLLKRIKNKEIKKEEIERRIGIPVEDTIYKEAKEGSLSSKYIDKIITSKSVNIDFEHSAIIKSDCTSTPTLINAMTRVVKNPLTGRTETQKMWISDVPGVYNSTITDDLGNTRVESFARKNSDGSIYVEKNLESLDGTKTYYTWQGSKDNNDIKMHYQIKTARGEVLTTVDRTFKRVNPKLAYSSINGHSYKIEKHPDAYAVTDNLNGKTTKMTFRELTMNAKSAKHLEKLYDQLSGDALLDIYNRGYKYDYINDPDNCEMRSDEMLLRVKDDLFDYSHEHGHCKDFISLKDEEPEAYYDLLLDINDDYDKEVSEENEYKDEFPDADEDNIEDEIDYEGKDVTISSNPEVRKAYEQERMDFMKAFPGIEQGYLDYMIDRIDHYNGFLGALKETIAETNGLLSTATGSTSDDGCQTRSYYLQKYFPRTIAAASKLLMPNGNIYINDGASK